MQMVKVTEDKDRLCLAIIIALPAATPGRFKNEASYALGGFVNCKHRNGCVGFKTHFLSKSMDGQMHMLLCLAFWHLSGTSVY